MYQERAELFVPKPIGVPGVIDSQHVVSEALKLLGAKSVHYVSPELGMSEEDGFDCSGFVIEVFRRAGVPINDRHCNEMFDYVGPLVHISKPGDLLFTSRRGEAPNHVGIIVNEDTLIHAPGRKDTVVELKQWKKTPIKNLSSNAIYSENPIGIKRVAMKKGRWHVL